MPEKYTEQPAPMSNDSQPIWDLVVADMSARNALGVERYGTPLQAFNGRKALQDVYEEALDMVVYLKQQLVEEDVKNARIVEVINLADAAAKSGKAVDPKLILSALGMFAPF